MPVHNGRDEMHEGLSLQRILRTCDDPLQQAVEKRHLVGDRYRDLFAVLQLLAPWSYRPL